MPLRNKVICLGKSELEFFDPIIMNFYEPATFLADKMIVMPVPEFLLISCFFVPDLYFVSQAAFTHQFQIAAHRSKAYVRMFSFHRIMQLISSDMPAGRKECIKDIQPLPCIP